MPADTTLALFAREEGRAKAPAALHEAVARAGGQIVAQMTVKPWELPKWAREQAARLGLELDAAAAKALVAPGRRAPAAAAARAREARARRRAAGRGDGAARVESRTSRQRAAHSAEWRAFALGGRARRPATAREATLIYLRLREQGERLSGLTYLMAQRLRDALEIAARLRAGESAAGGQARAADAPAGGRAASSRTSRAPTRSSLHRALARSPSSSSTRAAARCSPSDRTPPAGMDEDTIVQRDRKDLREQVDSPRSLVATRAFNLPGDRLVCARMGAHTTEGRGSAIGGTRRFAQRLSLPSRLDRCARCAGHGRKGLGGEPLLKGARRNASRSLHACGRGCCPEGRC